MPRQPGAVPLYFAFPDGVYDYVCAECTALCCKGHGFAGSLKRELRSLFVLYPKLESMAVSRVGDTVEFLTTKEGCVLLDADNRCRIEKEHSKARKPTVCNLFPFNDFTLIGKTMVVTPNFLCPLRLVVPASPGQVAGTHSTLEAGIRDTEVLSKEYITTKVVPRLLHPATDPVHTLEREKRFRDLCAVSLGHRRFIDTLKEASIDGAALDQFVARVAHLMKIEVRPSSRPRDQFDDLLLAIAPPYRMFMLRLASEQILRALAIAELTVRQGGSLSNLPPSMQSVMNITSGFAPVQRLLAYGDEPFEFVKPIPKKDLTFYDADLTFAAYLFQRRAAGSAGVLGALEEVIPAEMPVSDRSILFQKLGNLVDERRYKARR